jgi:predicted permease
MSSFRSDLRFSLRSLAKSPGVAVIAVLTLGIGIGAVTSMYSALRALVVEPFSYPQSDRIVHVWSKDGQPLSAPDFHDIRAQATSFAEFGVYSPRDGNLGGEHPEAVAMVTCTSGVLRTFGVRPAMGRWFDDHDDEKGAAPVAILSHALWQRSFGGDPNLVGHTIRINEANVTVVGIMPASFEFVGPWLRTRSCEVFLPAQLTWAEDDRGSHWLCAVARLKDGVSVAAADSEIKAIGARLKAAHPETNSQKPLLVRALQFEMTRYLSSRVWMLFGAVVLVLLVACANVASMLLARSARRQSEFGVRVALGASQGRLLSLALTESLVLSIAGSIVGLGLALAGLPALRALAPATDARKAAMTLDGNVLLFAIGLSLITALIAGLPPALAAMRVPVVELLRTDGRGATGSRARHRLLRALIIGQIAVAFILANGAALFSASYSKLLAANSSLATEQVLSAQANLRGGRFETKETRAQFWQQIVDRVAALPGVAAVGITSKLPLEGGSNMTIMVNDEVFDPLAHRTLAEVSSVTPNYFTAVGLKVLQGRTLAPEDAGEDAIGIVVNKALAETCWPGKDPIGQIVRPGGAKAWYHARVVGVVENVRQWGADVEPKPEIYWTADRSWNESVYIIVRSTQPAASLAPMLRRAVAELDAELPLNRVRTLQGVVDDATQGQRAITRLVNVFMALALGLLAVGLYGTLSYYVLQRTREIGVRLALGADRNNILGLVLQQGSAWVAIGIVLGVGGALGLATSLRAMIYGVDAMSPTMLLLASAAVGASALLACWLPARRASRVDPIVALRAD